MSKVRKIFVGIFLAIIGIVLYRRYKKKKKVKTPTVKIKKSLGKTRKKSRVTNNTFKGSGSRSTSQTYSYTPPEPKNTDKRNNPSMRASGRVKYVRMGSKHKIASISIKCNCNNIIYDSEVEVKQSERNFECPHCKQKYHINLETLRSVKEGDRF